MYQPLPIGNEEVTDQSELARLAHVTPAADAQIMNLLPLAPDIQQSLLFLPQMTSGKTRIHLRLLRPIAAETDWRKQRELWRELERV